MRYDRRLIAMFYCNVQGSAEQTVCNNALSALTVLQGYRSPYALDAAGYPQRTTAYTSTDNNNSSVTAPAAQQQQQQRDVYKYRLPFRELRAEPLQLLRAQVTASTVASLVPLARPLGLEASALYALLVETLYSTACATATTTAASQQQQQQRQLPPFAEVLQWLQAVKSPAVACRTAQWMAQQCLLNSTSSTSSNSSSSSSSSAIDSAIAALEHAVVQAKLAIAQGATALPLLPVRIAAQLQPTATGKHSVTAVAAEEQELAADKVYKLLKHERMELRHHRVVLQHLDARYAAELSQFYGSR
jgi:hypothetical protein